MQPIIMMLLEAVWLYSLTSHSLENGYASERTQTIKDSGQVCLGDVFFFCGMQFAKIFEKFSVNFFTIQK